MKIRIQNKVAGSELTLPICAVVTVALWWLPERTISLSNALGLVLCLLATYVIMETNNQLNIIRIRTRIMSCVWLVLAASLPFMHRFDSPLIATTLLCVAYPLLFRSYELRQAQTYVFHFFLLLSIGSIFAPIMLLMTVPFFLYLIFLLRSLTAKAFWAGILGLILPYLSYAIWLFLFSPQSLAEAVDIICKSFAITFPPPLEEGSELRLTSFVILALLSILSIIHYLYTRYNDKIRVRMILYIYGWQTLLLLFCLVLWPSQYETSMALLVASAGPLIAHHIALSRNILGTAFFFLSLLLTAALATLNLWMTSFSFF